MTTQIVAEKHLLKVNTLYNKNSQQIRNRKELLLSH